MNIEGSAIEEVSKVPLISGTRVRDGCYAYGEVHAVPSEWRHVLRLKA